MADSHTHAHAVSLPPLGQACFTYLLLSEEIENSYLPSVVNPVYLLQVNISHATALIERFVGLGAPSIVCQICLSFIQAGEESHIKRIGEYTNELPWSSNSHLSLQRYSFRTVPCMYVCHHRLC